MVEKTSKLTGLVIVLIVGLVVGLIAGYAVAPRGEGGTASESRISELKGQVTDLQGEVAEKDGEISRLESELAELQGAVGLASISVTPPGAEVKDGETSQFKAVARYLDGSKKDVTAEASWKRAGAEVVRLMCELNAKHASTCIIVTQNRDVAKAADRIIHIVDERIESGIRVKSLETRHRSDQGC